MKMELQDIIVKLLQEIFLKILAYVRILQEKLLHDAATRLWFMCHPSMCTNQWRPTTSTLCPLILLRKKMQEVSHSYTQNKVQKYHLREFSGCFECNIYHVTVLSRLKKKGKKMNNSCFQPFQAGQFVHCYSNCRLAQPILNYATKLLMSKNTLIEAAILF